MRVGVPGKVWERRVGGDTAHARALYERLRPLGVNVGPLAEGLLWPRGTGVDLLHYPAGTGAPVLAPVPGRVPVCATLHGLPPHRPAGTRRTLAERIRYRRVGGMARAADAVVTASEFSAGRIRRAFGVPARRLHVIPPGVDTGRFHPGADGDAALLGPVRLPERFVLSLGPPSPRANVPLLVEATARLGVPLVVAGGPGGGDARTVRVLDAAPHARRLGAVPGPMVAPLLRAAAVLAVPSPHGGCGLPVLEAMACGTPVVISDRGALPETAGGAARIARGLTVAGLAAALAEVLDDESAAVGLRELGLGRARAFTWDATARRHLEVFQTLVG
ncbi:glycosyltransferase family 1 protein [Actinomadura kijaniata]|uniref:Glycosyltransferase involved in cell wall biosynthesis n=1 Tax=Actinomadura namibiensis TaxID=182080 RepID=A0A7W3QIU2_ACTNM|nr:glycosyltransferase family 1 protein [Actinomadura namibiensis]MBA8948612.1 glycosyltransferase involved in cell wall biosynthesis [Actinomadura namibiensis]